MSRLRARPVRRYASPAFPTKLEVLADATQLEKHLPPAWFSRADMASAVTVFLAANAAGCSGAVGQDRAAGTGTASAKAAIVAPLFEHGEGRGSVGCSAVAPPVFLSEEEALQVISEELTHHGLDMSQRDVEMSSVSIKSVHYQREYNWVSGRIEIRSTEKRAPLSVDLHDQNKRVAVEFVSRPDYFELGGRQSSASIQGYDLKQVSSDVAREVRRAGKGVYFGTMYDPMTCLSLPITRKIKRGESVGSPIEDPQAFWQKRQEAARAESRRMLRRQVRDFVDWLKGQGVI